MRVLIIHHGVYVYGGAELLIVRLANYMTKKGIENAILTTSMLPEMAKDLDNTEIIIRTSSKNLFGEFIALHKGVRDNIKDFHVLNPHNYPAELSVFPYCRPVVWMCNEPVLYLIQKLRKSILSYLKNKSLLFLEKFVSKYFIKYTVVADEFNAKRFERIYHSKPEIIYYGIDYDFFSNGDRKKALEKYDLFKNFIVLHVGMITPFKNQIESIKAIEKLKNKIPNIKLILTGFEEPIYKSILEKYIKKRNLDNIVLFTGHLDQIHVRDLYHTCHVLLHPIKSQGGWLSVFEALCANKPVIVSKEMTASSIIEGESIGIVTKNYDEAIYDIFKYPNKYYKMAKRGQTWVKNNLSWEKFCESMIKFFYKAMNEGK